MIVIDFGTFQIVFCFVVGLVWGVAYLIFRGLGFRWHGVAVSRTEPELDEDGAIKFFTLWHFGLVSSVTIVLFLWMAGQPGSFADMMIQQSWSYLVAQNIIG